MATEQGVSRRAINGGARELRIAAARFGEDARELRLRAGVSQAAVGRSIGVARSAISRLEAGDPQVAAFIRARVAALLGAEFRFGLYPGGTPLIFDAAHARVVEALLATRDPSWRATVEAPVPGPGRRSVDVRLERGPDTVLMEVEMRLRRLEEIVRELHGKRDAFEPAEGTSVHVVLVLPATRHHRALVRAHPETIRTAFPADPRALDDALRAPDGHWPGDGILWVPTRRRGE